MKRKFATVLSLFSLLIVPAPAFAAFSVTQGGTGQTFFTAGSLLYGNGTNPIATTTPGTLGYVLQFNGTTPTWVSTSSLGVVTPPGGSDMQIQFNDNGVFGGNSGFTYNGELNIDGNINVGQAGDTIYFLNPFGGPAPYMGVDWPLNILERGTVTLNSLASSSVLLLSATGGNGQARLKLNQLTQERSYSFPDADGTFGLLEANQTWTGDNTFSKGASATTTVTFGTLGDTSSKVCFNTKNSAGQDASFYINNDFQLVIASGTCQ
jgi:hypothetical protein